jgi:hypothetical protein
VPPGRFSSERDDGRTTNARRDYLTEGWHGWVRLYDKGGQEHEAPRIPKVETHFDEYNAAAGIADDKDGPLFRTTGRSSCTVQGPTQQDGYRLIQRHAKRASILHHRKRNIKYSMKPATLLLGTR